MSKARAKGTKFEVWLLARLRYLWGEHIHRAPLRGTQDHGDYVGTPYLVEAKSVATPRFPEWIRKARAKVCDGCSWVIVWKGDMRTAEGQPVVVMPLGLYEELTAAHETVTWARPPCDQGA